MVNSERKSADEWESVQRLEDVQLPEWPRDAFPKPAQQYIDELSRSTETPIELPATLFLSAVSTVSQKKYEVEIKNSYREPTNTWFSSILPPASRKSSVYNQTTAPIREWEELEKAELDPIIKAQISKSKTLEEKIRHFRRLAAKTKDDSSFNECQEQIALLENEVDALPIFPQIWTSDVTPEHLGELMAKNDEAMAILSDEGGIFDIIAGLYSNGRANIDILLQAHSGGPVRVGRASKPPIFLKKALLTIGITVQPEVIKKVCRNKTFRGRGLLGRFLYVMPPSNIGYRTLEEESMDDATVMDYRNRIMAILKHPYEISDGKSQKHILKLETEAYLKWLEYSKLIEMMMGEEIDFLSHITDWAGKLSGQIARIAGLLHIYRYALENPWEREISLEDMQGAVKIGHALVRHALKVFGLIYEDEEMEVARNILKWIEGYNLKNFTHRECARRFRVYDQSKILRSGLNKLKDRGYLHEWKMQPSKGAPSQMFEVNPKYKENNTGE